MKKKPTVYVQCAASPTCKDVINWTQPPEYDGRVVQHAFSQPDPEAAYYMRVTDLAYPAGHPLRVTFYRLAEVGEVVIL